MPGEGRIHEEILSNLNKGIGKKYILCIIESIWSDKRLPVNWDTELIYPIHKKNDPKNCGNYRGIALLNTVYNVLAYYILPR